MYIAQDREQEKMAVKMLEKKERKKINKCDMLGKIANNNRN